MSFSWFKLYADLVDHPKLLRLERDLKQPLALAYLIRCLVWVKRYAPTGVIGDDQVGDLERGARWRRAPGSLVAALHRAGFLDRVGSDPGASGVPAGSERGPGAVPAGSGRGASGVGAGWEWHGWWEHQGALVDRADKDAERAKNRPPVRKGHPRVEERRGEEIKEKKQERRGEESERHVERPVQEGLPDVPQADPEAAKRKPSWQEQAFDDFVLCRENHLTSMGLWNKEEEEPRPSPAYVNTAIARCVEKAEPEDKPAVWLRMVDLYLADPWGAKESPAWPFGPLVAGKKTTEKHRDAALRWMYPHKYDPDHPAYQGAAQ